MIAEIAQAVTAGLGLIKPVVDEKYAQKYDNEHIDRIKRLQEIMAEPLDVVRAPRVAGYVSGLLNAAGKSVVGVSGASIEVPMECFGSLVECVSEGIRDREKLAKLTFKVPS